MTSVCHIHQDVSVHRHPLLSAEVVGFLLPHPKCTGLSHKMPPIHGQILDVIHSEMFDS